MTNAKMFLATKILEEAMTFLQTTMDIVDEPTMAAIRLDGSDSCGSRPGITMTSLRPWQSTSEIRCAASQGSQSPLPASSSLATRRNIQLVVTYSPLRSITTEGPNDLVWTSRCIADRLRCARAGAFFARAHAARWSSQL